MLKQALTLAILSTALLYAQQPVNCVSGCAGGSLSNNNAAPSSNNGGVLPAVANANPPTLTEGNQVLQSLDLRGNTRVFAGSILGSLTPITSVNGTLNATFSVVSNTSAPAVLVQLDQTTTITAGAIRFQVSYDGTNFVNASADAVNDPTSTTDVAISMPYTLQASTNKSFLVTMKGAQSLQILVSTAMTGTGAITPFYSVLPSFIGIGPVGLNTIANTAVVTAGVSGSLAVGGKNGHGGILSGDTNPITIAGYDYSSTKSAWKVDTSGIGRVGISGNTGAAMDAAGQNATVPANELLVGAEFQSGGPTILTTGHMSPLQTDQMMDLRVIAGGQNWMVFNANSATSQQITSATVTGSAIGTFSLQANSITGSPSGCTIIITNLTADNSNGPIGNGTNNGSNSVWGAYLGSLTNTSYSFAVNPSSVPQSLNAAAINSLKFSFQCVVYPSGGTISGDFNNSQPTVIAGADGNAAKVNPQGELTIGPSTPFFSYMGAGGTVAGSTPGIGNVTASGTTVSVNVIPNFGHTLIGLCGVNNTGTLTISDNYANNWYTAKAQTGTNAGALVAYMPLPTGSANVGLDTVTCTAGTTGVVSIQVYDVNGLLDLTNSPSGVQLDALDSNTGTTQTAAALSAGLNPTIPNEIAFAAIELTANNAGTAANSWTVDTNQGATGGNLIPARQYLESLDKITGNLATFSSSSYAMAAATFRPVSFPVQGQVGLYDGTNRAAITSGNALKIDQTSIAGNSIATAASGVPKVGIVGNAGAAVDAASNAALPANALAMGFETATQTTTQPTASTAGNLRFGLARTDGTLYVAPHGPVIWSCGLNAIAATLTQCQAAPAAGLRLYITDVISQSNTSTAGLFTLRFGTGSNCGTGTGNLIFGSATALMASPANTVAVNHFHLTVPIAVTAANAVCVLGVATNTTNIEINGYTAP